jgi:hypothetical protein
VTQRYEAEGFDPAAPIARVTLKNVETGFSANGVRMLVDTGADATLLPAGALVKLGLTPVENPGYKLVGFDGSTSLASTAYVIILMGSIRVQADFPVIQQEYGIIGRDILNRLRLDLNGPMLIWDYSTL